MKKESVHGIGIKEETSDSKVVVNSDVKDDILGFPMKTESDVKGKMKKDADFGLGIGIKQESDKNKSVEDKSFMDCTSLVGESDVKGKMKKEFGLGVGIKEEIADFEAAEDETWSEKMDSTIWNSDGDSDIGGGMKEEYESEKKKMVEEIKTGLKEDKVASILTELTDDVGKHGVKLIEEEAEKSDRVKASGVEPCFMDQRFSEMQAQLGYDQPSKVLDWLMDAAANSIQDLTHLGGDDSHPNLVKLAQTLQTPQLQCKHQHVMPDMSKHKETPTRQLNFQDLFGNKPKSSSLSQNSTADIIDSTAHESSAYGFNSTGQLAEKVCLNCMLHCGIFPKGYEIDKDTLIQLWMAAGFITNEPMEDISAEYLRLLVHEKIISISSQDISDGKVWYNINHLSSSEDGSSRINHVMVDARNPTPSYSPDGGPCHIVTVQYSSTDFEVLKKFGEMRALLFLRGHGTRFERLPYDFFISLKHLETLDLSGTRLSELPTSLGNAKSLRYLDLSDTFIKQLPETIDRLHSLQTLKLHKCTRLTALPKGISKLTSLRHLGFDTPSRLRSMPPRMGALTRLRTLPEFLVGVEYGCGVEQIKNMNDLKGSICISRLEHVASSVEAREANLINKQGLTKLELRWSNKRRGNISVDDEVMEYLQPYTNLRDLRILYYGGTAFPTWISHPSFVNLASITIFKCESCQLLPSLGKLPSLESLSLYELQAVRFIDVQFCGAGGINVAFPKLQKLEIISMLNLEEWKDLQNCDFPCLVEMTVKDCPKLVGLWRTLGVRSLKYLEINNCPILRSFPKGELSVETLVIEGCPLLTSSFSEKDGQYWHKAVGVPTLFIDRQEVSYCS